MFKDKLKQLRTEHNLTQAVVANELGVSSATIGNYEQGTREPRNHEMWQKIADYFNVSVDELMDNRISFIDYDFIKKENKILKLENALLKSKIQSILNIISEEI